MKKNNQQYLIPALIFMALLQGCATALLSQAPVTSTETKRSVYAKDIIRAIGHPNENGERVGGLVLLGDNFSYLLTKGEDKINLIVNDLNPEYLNMENVTTLVKNGNNCNRDISGSDFAWALDRTMENQRYPEQMMVFERREWGNFYGYLEAVKKEGVIVARGDEAPAQLTKLMARVVRIHDEIYDIEKGAIGSINYGIERLRLQERGLELDGVIAPQKYAEISAKRAGFDAEYADLQARLKSLYEAFNRDSLIAHTVDGRQIEISLGKVVRFYQPNQMSLLDKVAFYGGV